MSNRDCSHTVIPSVNGGEKLLVLLNFIGQAAHELASIRHWHALPCWVLERSLSSANGGINISSAGSLYGSDFLLGTKNELYRVSFRALCS